MGIVAGIGAAAAAASLAGSVSGLAGGGGGSSGGQGGYYGGSSPPPAYIPAAQPTADSYYQTLFQQMTPEAQNLPNQVVPSYYSLWPTIAHNPTAVPAQQGVQAAANYGTGTLAPQLQSAAGSLTGLGQGAAAAAPSILQTGFDPQQALYNRTAQQVTDQSNAINSMYGLGASAAGAGLTQQAQGNFNIDWQNQQLARQVQAAQGYGALTNTTGQAYSGAADLGASALNTMATSATLPYQTLTGQTQDTLNQLNSLSSGVTNAYGLSQNDMNALAAYLKLGQSATGVGQAGAAQNFGNNQTLGGNLGSALSGLSSPLQSLSGLFSGGTPTYSGADPTGAGINYGTGSGGYDAYGAMYG